MTAVLDKKSIEAYARAENRANHYGATADAISAVVDLVSYMGTEMYRPITRLLLSNWKELNDRIDHFTDYEWQLPTEIAESTGLPKRSVALLIEVLEGADTHLQLEQKDEELTEKDWRELQAHMEQVRAEEEAARQN